MHTYEIDIAGLKRELPICRITDDLYIAAFDMFGDVELTVHCAAQLLEILPDYDYLIAPEAKSIPLLYEIARQSGADRYFLARKNVKGYMTDPFIVDVEGVTVDGLKQLVIDRPDAQAIKDKRMLILDDVASTGGAMKATEELVKAAGGIVVGKACVLAEGDAMDGDDMFYLQKLPLFNADGTTK